MSTRGNYVFNFLYGEMVKRLISIESLAHELCIQPRTLRNKLNGLVDFTWNEVCVINKVFPEFTKEELMSRVDRETIINKRREKELCAGSSKK